VLVIDDTDATREGLVELLRLRGYSALGAKDGREGLKCLVDNPHVCVVVLDLAMPRTDGHWFRQQQLRHPVASAIPVIVFTGRPETPQTIEAFNGCEVLQKPFGVDRLFDAIEHCCETP
jgi:DNA-binding NtrC family response regulator